jgi:2,4-dienoyl-CoA reductase-like NADH-dependent reductase (Old Yellow Enzyme family)
MWMQINHPGRQVQARMPGVVWGPSAVAVELGKHSKRFGRPVAMTEGQIRATVERFATTARLAEQAGFDGVEIHAAHGYLLSQFLSPRVNKRTDEWGGELENRARLLLDVVRAVRAAVSSFFTVAVKLNSADFQRGGFEVEDAEKVIAMLEPLGLDLVELSGGSYESPAMAGRPADDRTQAREAYFLELAADLAKTSPLPLMLTGGITRRETAEEVLASGVELVGMATAWRSHQSFRIAGGKGVKQSSGWSRSPGRTRHSRRPRTWRWSATRCAASPAANTPPARLTRCTRSCATSATSGARSAATAAGSRAARALSTPPGSARQRDRRPSHGHWLSPS